MDSNVKVTVALVVRNEEQYLSKVLDALLNQNFDHKYEILVIDGISTDKTPNIAKTYVKKYPKKIRYILNKKKITPVGRNLGITKGKGTYIAYMGGHSVPEKDWLKQLYDVMVVSKKDVACVTSVFTYAKDTNFIRNCAAEVFNTAFGGFGSTYGRITTKKVHKVKTAPFELYRKSAVKEVGLHNEKFIKSQDTEINYRLRKKGYTILRNPNAKVIYYPRESYKNKTYRLLDFAKQIYRYGFAKMYFIKHHPKSMFENLRTAVPALFVISLLILPALSLISPLFATVYKAEMVTYWGLTLLFSLHILIRTRSLTKGAISVIMFPIEHISYGVGYLYALLGGKFKV